MLRTNSGVGEERKPTPELFARKIGLPRLVRRSHHEELML